jgi:DNA-binding NarL/FixJ family response regulator
MLEAHARVEVATDPQHAHRKAVARTPTVLFAAGPTARETLQRIRELHPGLNALLAGSDADISRLLEGLDQEPAVLLPASVGAPAIALAIRAILSASSAKPHKRRASARALGRTRWTGELPAKPQSYAHLAGLLPRALERTVDFDVGAAVIARPGSEPIVDVHATRDCPAAMLQLVRDRALALFQVTSGHASRTADDPSSTSGDLVASAIHVPLVAQGRVVGLTYLASSRSDAFGAEDRRLLAELAANASGAYRRLESTVRRLRLTPRQSQVLSLIASGLSDKEVGQRLGLAHRTVRTHIDRLLREHGLRSRTEAVAAWLRGQQE